ncbi:MAG: site-2 protease family protein, partial [bacterium]|nr:site-2 protease family protein [bacterium]
MGGAPWRIGRIGRTPLFLDRSWPIGVLLLASLYFSGLTAGGHDTTRALALAAILTGGLFLSVFIHELSHGAAGRALRRPPESITLTLWGGYTTFRGAERGPGAMALTALAGPASNLLLALALDQFIGLGRAAGWGWVAFLAPLALVNLIMGLFNLAPGLPMDGGHLVHAAAWKLTGSRDRGMLIAAWSGVVLAIALGAWALLQATQRGLAGGTIWLFVIAFVLWGGAQRALQHARARVSVATLDLQRVMVEVPVLSPTTPLSRVPAAGAVLVEGGNVVGVVLPEDLARAAGSTLPASAASRVLPAEAVVGARYGADAAAEVSMAARASSVVVYLDGGRAWLAGVG